MKMCASFAAAGAAVHLVLPRRKNNLSDDPFSYYGVARTFTISWVPTMNVLWLCKGGYYIQTAWFACACLVYGLRHTADVYYSRDESALFFLKYFKRTVLEVHAVPTKHIFFYRLIIAGIAKFISTNQWKANFLKTTCGVGAEQIVVFPNAVDIPEHQARASACAALWLAPEKKYVVYVGHLYEWKGAHVLAAAAALLPADTEVIFVGGLDADVAKLQKINSRIRCVGHQRRDVVQHYLAAADLLVLPNVPVTEESVYATSPMKLFEYMAAQKPIIASDLPSIREIVDESSATLVPPGDAVALARAIEEVFAHPEQAQQKVRRAFEVVRTHTWDARAHAILNFIV